jgi:hypothetical protein
MKAKHIIPAIGLAMYMIGGVALAAPVPFNMGWNYGSPVNIALKNATGGSALNGGAASEYGAGGNFGSVAGRSGDSNGATLDGLKLSFVYCIDIVANINLSSKYTAEVSFDGKISDRGLLPNAGKIAWLMSTQASTADTLDKQTGLQSAIWHQLYGDKFSLINPSNAVKTAYAGYIAALGNNVARLNSVAWINVGNGAQDQVALFADPNNKYKGQMMATPIPSAVWLFGSAMVGLVGLGKRKGQKTAVAM